MIITIPGPPISKARHRSFVLPNGQIRNYDPLDKEKHNVSLQMRNQLIDALNSGIKEIELEASSLTRGNNFELSIELHMPIPVSVSNSKRNVILWGLEHHPSSKDLDNLVKFYLDCANGILFPDDHMITKITAIKKFSSNPRTVLNIMQKKDTQSSINKVLELYSPEELALLIDNAAVLCSAYELLQFTQSYAEKNEQLITISEQLIALANDNANKFKKIVALNKDLCHDAINNTLGTNHKGPIC